MLSHFCAYIQHSNKVNSSVIHVSFHWVVCFHRTCKKLSWFSRILYMLESGSPIKCQFFLPSSNRPSSVTKFSFVCWYSSLFSMISQNSLVRFAETNTFRTAAMCQLVKCWPLLSVHVPYKENAFSTIILKRTCRLLVLLWNSSYMLLVSKGCRFWSSLGWRSIQWEDRGSWSTGGCVQRDLAAPRN